MTDILGYDYETIDRIVTFADNNDLPPVAMIALALQESNLGLFAHGDVNIGGSYGVYQIYVAAHGGPPDHWMGYEGLDASMAEMVGRWHNAFINHGYWDAITSDLVGFMQAWAPDAQGSIPWDEPIARRQVSKAVAIYSLYLKGQTAQPESPPAPAPPSHVKEYELRLGLAEIVSSLLDTVINSQPLDGASITHDLESIGAVLAALVAPAPAPGPVA